MYTGLSIIGWHAYAVPWAMHTGGEWHSSMRDCESHTASMLSNSHSDGERLPGQVRSCTSFAQDLLTVYPLGCRGESIPAANKSTYFLDSSNSTTYKDAWRFASLDYCHLRGIIGRLTVALCNGSQIFYSWTVCGNLFELVQPPSTITMVLESTTLGHCPFFVSPLSPPPSLS